MMNVIGLRRVSRGWLPLAVFLAAAVTVVGPAAAQDAKLHFDIPSQDLATALEAFARQSNSEILFSRDQTRGKKAPAVSGAEREPVEALTQILSGSGLVFRRVNKNTFVVEPGARNTRADTAAAEAAGTLSPIVVESVRLKTAASTGTKTDTPLLDTPLAISVIPKQILVDQGITILDQALKNVSGVRATNNGGVQEGITVRGFTTTTTYIDGFKMEDNIGNGMADLGDAGSIEVLKGPAAVLFGRGEPGGIVNVITKKPLDTPYYSIFQQAGSWGNTLSIVDATGPVNDAKGVLYRVIASYTKNGESQSWRDGIFNKEVFVAPKIQWLVSDSTQVSADVRYSRNIATFDSAQWVPYDPAIQQFVWLPRKQNLAESEPVTLRTTHAGINWSHDFNNDWSLKQAVIWHDVTIEPSTWTNGAWIQPNEAGNGWDVLRGVTDVRAKTLTKATILDLTGHFDVGPTKHTVLTGADYYWHKLTYTESFTDPYGGDPAAPTDVFHPTRAILTATQGPFSGDGLTRSTGLYAQDQMEMPHHLFLLAGLRYQKVTQDGFFGSSDDSGVTPRAGLLWKARPWLSLYANYAQNFGASNGVDWTGAFLPPEKATNKEVGVKGEFFGGKLISSLAVYDLTKTNVVVPDAAHPAPACGGFGCSILVGQLRSRGTEFDLQGEIRPDWFVSIAHTYTDARVTKSTPGSWYVEGSRFANVPPTMLNLWSTYYFRSAGWRVGGGVNWQTSTVDRTNTIKTPSYAVTDAMAEHDFQLGRFKVTAQLNLTNIFNHMYYQNASTDGGYTGYLTYGAPRAAKLSVRAEF